MRSVGRHWPATDSEISVSLFPYSKAYFCRLAPRAIPKRPSTSGSLAFASAEAPPKGPRLVTTLITRASPTRTSSLSTIPVGAGRG